MLVLTRTVGESIDIDDTIRITVSRVDGERVRIGIEAPRTMRIVRSELEARPPVRRAAGALVDLAEEMSFARP